MHRWHLISKKSSYKISQSKQFKCFWLEFIAIVVLCHCIADPHFQWMTAKRQNPKCSCGDRQQFRRNQWYTRLVENWLISYFVSVLGTLEENYCSSVWGDPGQRWELAGLAEITHFALLGTPVLFHPKWPKFRMTSLLW